MKTSKPDTKKISDLESEIAALEAKTAIEIISLRLKHRILERLPSTAQPKLRYNYTPLHTNPATQKAEDKYLNCFGVGFVVSKLNEIQEIWESIPDPLDLSIVLFGSTTVKPHKLIAESEWEARDAHERYDIHCGYSPFKLVLDGNEHFQSCSLRWWAMFEGEPISIKIDATQTGIRLSRSPVKDAYQRVTRYGETNINVPPGTIIAPSSRTLTYSSGDAWKAPHSKVLLWTADNAEEPRQAFGDYRDDIETDENTQ